MLSVGHEGGHTEFSPRHWGKFVQYSPPSWWLDSVQQQRLDGSCGDPGDGGNVLHVHLPVLGPCQSGVWTAPYNQSFQVYLNGSNSTEKQTQVVVARLCALSTMKAAPQGPNGVGANACLAIPTGSTWQLIMDNQGISPPSFCGFTCLY